MYYVEQNATFEALVEVGVSGLAGSLEIAIHDGQSNVIFGPTSAGIAELEVAGQPTGWYSVTLTAPATLGQYGIIWSTDGTFDPETSATDELTVIAEGAGSLSPLPPLGDDGSALGPCSAWTTSEEVAECCSVEVGSDFALFDEVVNAATRALWEFSARQFSGTCTKTVYPRCASQSVCSYQVLSRGHIVWPTIELGLVGAFLCGCHRDSVLLSGYPVKEILEVVIDGATFDLGSYELRNYRYLVRTDGSDWPTEEGWSVRYTYGQVPPEIGQMAARELACEMYKECRNGADDCLLPSGIIRIQRQGITIERNAFTAWGRQLGIWRTGLPLVDIFLNAYNPAGLRSRPRMMTPGRRHYPKAAGV